MTDKHAQMREMARDLIRDSAIEDAIAQKIAQIIEFIHEDRIKPLEKEITDTNAGWEQTSNMLGRQLARASDLEAKLAKAVEVLVLCRDMFDEVAHPSDPMSVLLNTTLAELEGDKT
jgi:hypothetical protein